MKTFRWIIFLPVLVLCHSICQLLAENIVSFLYGLVFPIKNFWGYINTGWSIPIIILTVIAFIAFGIIVPLQKVPPNSLLATRIALSVYTISYASNYYLHFDEKTTIRIVFDSITVLTLITSSFNKN